MLDFVVRRILGQVTLQKAGRKHADVANALAMWSAVVAAAGWTNFAELKADFPSADIYRLSRCST